MGKEESDVWVVRAVIRRTENLHGSRIGCRPLIPCRLLTAKSQSVRGASHQSAFMVS